MKSFKITLCTLTAFLLMHSNAFAQANLPKGDASTAALVDLCKNLDDVDGQNFCFGFGEGVYQSYLANLNAKGKPTICFSSNTETREDVLRAFLRWNQVNPQFNQERAAKTLMRFFEAKYPCK